MMVWTDQRNEELRGYFEAKMSASEMAAKMGNGLTRSAILGKCHRLGLKRGHKEIYRKPSDPRQARKKPTNRYATRGGAYSVETKPGAPPPETIVDLAPLNIPLADIRALQCRWVSSEQPVLFCGHSALVGSWCEAHRLVVFKPEHGNQGRVQPHFTRIIRKKTISAQRVLAWDFERGTVA
jgi:GcrA cell cycle regulator